jgi:hypothetical protein
VRVTLHIYGMMFNTAQEFFVLFITDNKVSEIKDLSQLN